MVRPRRHASRWRSRGSVRVTLSIAIGLVALTGGGAYAAYRYDASSAERILPGVEVANVDVGGMTHSEAVAAISEMANVRLDRELVVRAGGERWRVTPAELGADANVDRAVDRAFDVSDRYSWPFRVLYRLTDRNVNAAFGLRYLSDRGQIAEFVEEVARSVAVPPSDASVDFEGGELVLNEAEPGQELVFERSQGAVIDALKGSTDALELDMRPIEPEVTANDLGYTIVVSLTDLKLTLYDGIKVDRTYPVAAGQPAYPTPPGDWTIVNKAVNPTWTNPAPDGWGAGMPGFIPGGPGNPLGTRALYLDAPGIRIHGTSDPGSIGNYASHGCIRMLPADVEELFEIVPIGTPVFVTS